MQTHHSFLALLDMTSPDETKPTRNVYGKLRYCGLYQFYLYMGKARKKNVFMVVICKTYKYICQLHWIEDMTRFLKTHGLPLLIVILPVMITVTNCAFPHVADNPVNTSFLQTSKRGDITLLSVCFIYVMYV